VSGEKMRRPRRYLRSKRAEADVTSEEPHSIDTVHRAKGLDFAAVYLPQLSTRPTGDAEKIGERETLWLRQQFVGRTRARDRLWVGEVTPRMRSDS